MAELETTPIIHPLFHDVNYLAALQSADQRYGAAIESRLRVLRIMAPKMFPEDPPIEGTGIGFYCFEQEVLIDGASCDVPVMGMYERDLPAPYTDSDEAQPGFKPETTYIANVELLFSPFEDVAILDNGATAVFDFVLNGPEGYFGFTIMLINGSLVYAPHVCAEHREERDEANAVLAEHLEAELSDLQGTGSLDYVYINEDAAKILAKYVLWMLKRAEKLRARWTGEDL